ncbi:MAG: sulfur carrier protein ThiS [Candidatus Eremiobacteraeota bacterium]|nr:sulfur carrier protein ThiS [Candidatus Eremiobacteraeota bacterium]NNM93268.1 sulfur carrier protein ThiS [Candidatus Eremiobacteraeota bacterium]
MTVEINGEIREISAADATLAEVLATLGIEAHGVAIACNDCVVRRSDYARHRVAEGDRIEIVRAVAGG